AQAKGTAAEPSKDKAASPGSKGATAAKDSKISVSKATGPNAATVQEAFANSAKLNKKKVVIRGKVVKVSAQIMGKNWIHIQDGTGSQSAGNHNLVCTSKDMVEVGDVVTMSGVLAKDKDFGGGYKYAAIVEDATFKK
ncbi:MAG: DNA-binding protein, partial [Steroidobacteraceae bacterium]|nr:DNA-binding protein [Deltaproteobacteria bacterium]